MAGSDEWRCATATVPPGRTATFRLEQAGRALICSTHGALYEPASGLCTAGPCVGDRLTVLPLTLKGDTLVVRLPAPPPRR